MQWVASGMLGAVLWCPLVQLLSLPHPQKQLRWSGDPQEQLESVGDANSGRAGIILNKHVLFMQGKLGCNSIAPLLLL